MESVKGRLKIGMTYGDPHERIVDWGRDTGAPGNPILEYAAYVLNDPQPIETAAHRVLKSYLRKGPLISKHQSQFLVERSTDPCTVSGIHPHTHDR